MVAIPEITNYSQDQLAKARQLSPALARYLDLIQKKPENISQELRLIRHKHWCEAALAVIFKTASPEAVCQKWSARTREVLQKAWIHCDLQSHDVVLVEMGKLGASELNLSSDIDIFFVSATEPTKESLKKVRQFIQLLSEVTAFGFCYRIDMDLRPGGSTSPLILSFDQMTNHYGYQGETWERVAIIRQNISLGPDRLKKDLLEFCRKFAFRKHIDYGLFNDLFSMRERIQAHRSPSQNINIKFQPGGIRDLELLVHSLQLIHGGKNISLRTSSTTTALEALKAAHLLESPEADFLQSTYWSYRDLENHIQLQNDAHTYELINAQDPLFPADSSPHFLQSANKVAKIVDQLLAPYKSQGQFITAAELEEKFSKLQLADDESSHCWKKLLHAEARSREKNRDEQERRKFLNTVLDLLQKFNVDNRMAIYHLSQFLSTVKAKASFFSLFNKHTELTEEIVWIFSCSPYLSQILILRPELIDSFLLKKLEISSEDESQFYQSLQDYKLLSELIGASSFLRTRNVQSLTKNLSQTTDTIVRELLTFLENKTQTKFDILTLGKWAGHEMGLTSDLDFVFITDTAPSEAHFKMARRFINFLNSSTSGHKLYSIDLRLRPSGHAGPLLLTQPELEKYLGESSQVWERQAYLSNRSLRTHQTLPLMSARELTPAHKDELYSIQKKLLTPVLDTIDLKKSIGGLLHTELSIQMSFLNAQLLPAGAGLQNLLSTLKSKIDPHLCEKIYANYLEMRTYQQLLILVSGSPDSILDEHSESFKKICLISKNTPKVLFSELQQLLESQTELLNMLDPQTASFKLKT